MKEIEEIEKMEKELKKKKLGKESRHNSFEKIFLLSKFKEPKVRKNWFKSQFQEYITTIKRGVDNMERSDVGFARLRKKIIFNSFSNNRNIDMKKSNFGLTISKGNNYSKYNFGKLILKKKHTKQLPNYTYDASKNNSSINIDNSTDAKNKTVNKKNISNISKSIIKNSDNKEDIIKNRNKFYLNLKYDLSTLPDIPGIENKNKFIKKNLNNITEQTDYLEKKLIHEENKKYYKFKSKYNRLYKESKKNQININQYISPKNEHKFVLHSNDEAQKKIINLKKVMKQISDKLRNKYHDKPSISDIIGEVENFKFKEKILRERIKKSHEKFKYLIIDSNTIQKRIDTKFKNNNEN